MADIILHHYPMSPFAELTRLALGRKGLAWKSVIIPIMMPKPDLVELTGGYGRTPVLQIGADIYCDTAAILDVLERHAPSPSFYPAPLGPVHRMVAGWAGAAQFGAHIGAAFKNAPAGAMPPGFAEDRNRRFVGFDFNAMPAFAPHLETQVLGSAQWIETLLADGRSFIGGDAPGHGDFALYINLWFLKIMPFAAEITALVMSKPHLASWFARVGAIGHGESSEISGADAIAIARDATPAPAIGNVEGWPQGQSVMIRTEQSGDDPVRGSLLRCDSGGITVRRISEKAGEVNVHFPRLGQIVLPA